MLPFAGITKKMNSFEFAFVFFVLVPHTISFGRCNDISFSICWMSKDDAMERQNGNIWLNTTMLKSIRTEGKLTSLTVSPAVENKLTLKYGGSVYTWTFTISPRTKYTVIRGLHRPQEHLMNATRGILALLSPTEVFACENRTLFFLQEENFFLALGHTLRLPIKLDSRTTSMLLVSWLKSQPAVGSSHTLTLYHTELGSYNTLSTDTTTQSYYRFTALDPCSLYVVCVEIAGTNSFTCVSTITDPDVPRSFEVSAWNISSISLVWDCPENRKFSLFLLTAFYLNSTDQITEELHFWHTMDNYVFTLSDLQPCRKVKFGLQTVCQAGMESRYSKMIINDGNSGHSNIEAIRQTLIAPDNYTLSWEVKNISSISMFRIYHEGTLQGTTLTTSYTVSRLLPCHQYHAEVQALCGDSVLMSTKMVTVYTGPRGVSELRYQSKDSIALWTPGTSYQSAVAFLYELSLENGTILHVSNITETELHLQGLEEGITYILDVWEECDGRWESEHSYLCFTVANSSNGVLLRAAGPASNQDMQFDISNLGITMVVPWSLPEELQDEVSQPRVKFGEIVQNKLQELLSGFDQKVHVELASFEPANDPDKTEFLLMSFDSSNPEDGMPLPAQDQLHYIQSLNTTNISVRDGIIHWDGPDLCATFTQNCPRNSLCLNTLGSYTCVCQHGYYDVSPVLQLPVSSYAVCNEKGLFSQCLDKMMTGGIAKPYLTSHIGGKIDVKLNDGRCTVSESGMFYYFRTSRKASECGTEMRVNKTHIEFQNTLTVMLTKEQSITRRDLKVFWKCVYPLHYIRNAQVSVGMEWLSALSLVEFNSSLQLLLTMTLYNDVSYNHSYKNVITLEVGDTLFFKVALETNRSFASGVLLQVDSCWATETTNPQDPVHAIFLQDGCPIDDTFHWLSVNGLAQESRFSIKMFHMPTGLPLYFHCLADICGHNEECTRDCSSLKRSKRAIHQGKPAIVVSAGPLFVGIEVSSAGRQYSWLEHMMMIATVVGSIAILGSTVLLVNAIKAIMTYCEQLRLQ